MSLTLVVEGDTDLPFARKLATHAGWQVARELDMGGKGPLDANFPGYNRAAAHGPWFVLRDLDHDAPCGGAFRAERGIVPERWMAFRLAVRAVEAWALADRESFAEFFRVSEARLPNDPDTDPDPTLTIVNLCRGSAVTRIVSAMTPKPGWKTKVGALYEAKLIEFGTEYWDLARAMERSRSLRQARVRLGELAAAWATNASGQT